MHDQTERVKLTFNKTRTEPSYVEFVLITSLLMALTALSIDAMLPSLAQIGLDLNVANPNSRQLVISMIFFWLPGNLCLGHCQTARPKKAIYLGLAMFMLGAIISMTATSFTVLLVGRFIQGVGISAPRAVTLALVRDRYEGRAMARVMSFVMTIFILIPWSRRPLDRLSCYSPDGVRFWWLCPASSNYPGLVRTTYARDTRARESGTIFTAANYGGDRRDPQDASGVGLHDRRVDHWGIYRLPELITTNFQEQYDLGAQFPIYFSILAAAVGFCFISMHVWSCNLACDCWYGDRWLSFSHCRWCFSSSCW